MFFPHVRISHVLRFVSFCDLFTGPPSYFEANRIEASCEGSLNRGQTVVIPACALPKAVRVVVCEARREGGLIYLLQTESYTTAV
jgi:hypothetical protein